MHRVEQLRHCLELGSGFGASSCVMGAAAAEIGGQVVPVDISLHQPANALSLKAHVGLGDELEVVIDLELTAFKETEGGRIGWARKVRHPTRSGMLARLFGR